MRHLEQNIPTTLQQPSNLQALFKSGKVAIGTSLSYPSKHVAKTVAVTGADWCWVDSEHVAWSQKLLVECIQIIIHESGGTMIPVVHTAEEMQAVIAACRFPPLGHRSFPPFTFLPGVTDKTSEGETVFSIADKHVALIPQIETRLGIQNLDTIMKLDEVSGFMIGSKWRRLVIRMGMGLTLAFDGDEPEFVAAMQKATRVAKECNIPIVGATLTPEMVKKRISEGYRVILCAFDLHVLAYGMIKLLGEARVVAEEQMQVLHGN
ncbi:Pyruvate/Phosphoenolpyruvate kinase-like domain-containing protein [Mycena latifolia]|nr:Pyruvate/Phosphoenolpyruvate kinase-like domain-containing protein [Mycena latifolia]